jgi:hypothetical protein
MNYVVAVALSEPFASILMGLEGQVGGFDHFWCVGHTFPPFHAFLPPLTRRSDVLRRP